MNSGLEPISPKDVIPKKKEPGQNLTQIQYVAPAEEIPVPNINKYMKKINAYLDRVWEPHELRCGRSYILPNDIKIIEANEIIRIFSTKDWRVSLSVERRGIILSFKIPVQTQGAPNKRGTGGYL